MNEPVALNHSPWVCSRLELENRLAVLEQQRALQDSSDQALKEEWEERLSSAQQGEESLRRELQNLRSAGPGRNCTPQPGPFIALWGP